MTSGACWRASADTLMMIADDDLRDLEHGADADCLTPAEKERLLGITAVSDERYSSKNRQAAENYARIAERIKATLEDPGPKPVREGTPEYREWARKDSRWQKYNRVLKAANDILVETTNHSPVRASYLGTLKDAIYRKQPCGHTVELSVSAGGASATTTTSVTGASSGTPLTPDPVTDNSTGTSGSGAAVGIGLGIDLTTLNWDGGAVADPYSSLGNVFVPVNRYAAEDRGAFAAYMPRMPVKAAPRPRPLAMRFGIDANVYAFSDVTSTIAGIPGGPFGTATGADSFNIKDNVLLTFGGVLTVPVSPSWSVALTGGFAAVNKTITYNCVTYCAVAPATPAFSVSNDVWLPGGYVGGRVQAQLPIGWLHGATLGLDYKHVFAATRTVTLGNAALARSVTLDASQDIDLLTVRLAVPLRMP